MATKTLSSPLKALYTIFFALLVALFFGLGVAAFYPTPKAPDYTKVEAPMAESKTEEGVRINDEKMQKEQKEYQEKLAVYNRNVSVITLGLAVLALVVSLVMAGRIHLLSDGLMLGGVFTLIYSIGRGFATEDAKYRFIIVTVGLIITTILGYLKFIKPKEEV